MAAEQSRKRHGSLAVEKTAWQPSSRENDMAAEQQADMPLRLRKSHFSNEGNSSDEYLDYLKMQNLSENSPFRHFMQNLQRKSKIRCKFCIRSPERDRKQTNSGGGRAGTWSEPEKVQKVAMMI